MFLLVNYNIKKLRSLIDTVNYYKEYLQNGTYELSLNNKPFAFINNERNRLFSKIAIEGSQRSKFDEKAFSATIMNQVNKVTIKNTSTKSLQGSILMITARNNVKIFDTKSKKVIVFINNTHDFYSFKSTYDYFNKYYKNPILYFNDKEQFYVEKLIKYKPLNLWNSSDKEQAIYTVYNNILTQLNDIDLSLVKSTVVQEMLNDLSYNIGNENLVFIKIDSMIPSNRHNDSWPVIPCHGDIHFNNMLLDHKGDFFFIDWEDHQSLIFFYDFFNCMFVESIWHNNNYFLMRYLGGHYDYLLNFLFNNASLNYNKQNKKYYISLYLMSRLLYFELILNKDNLESILKKYDEFISLID